ncbi:glycosyltransferase family 4 protein [Aeromicrobium halocynthiae]|uniref:Glycosyltransferase family 4 protein n=1 Tax=Aeromicrobium halocynthiae TaxID=560557 RepID=A0ABN2W6T2_9ACTN
MSVRTAFVTQWYPPEPVEVPRSIALALTDLDHDVVVATGIPNYPDGVAHAGHTSWRRSRETLDGLEVHRYPLFPSHDQSAARRIVNYLTWAASSTALGWSVLRRSDVALVYSSPATAALAPALWRRAMRTPYVLIVQDLWPESVLSSGMIGKGFVSRLADRILRAFSNWTYRSAAEVVVISPGMRKVLVERGVSPEKITLVYNWTAERQSADGDRPREARRELSLPLDGFIVTYAGNVGTAQALDTLVLAARHLEDLEVTVVVAGDGVDLSRLQSLVADRGMKNVRFLGRLPAEQMPALRAASDLQVVSLADDPLFAVTMPSKVQAILESGSRLLVIGRGDAAHVAEASGAGWTAPPGDPEAVAAVIRLATLEPPQAALAREKAAQDYYQTHMSREIGSQALDQLLRRAAAREGSTR